MNDSNALFRMDMGFDIGGFYIGIISWPLNTSVLRIHISSGYQNVDGSS